jgi:hypothetical protein
MRTVVLMAMILATSALVSQARLKNDWTYDEMAKKAELILMVSVDKPSERTGAQELFHEREFDKVQTGFRVDAVLKGKYEGAATELQHLAYPKNGQHIVNGWTFKWFPDKDEMYLVFLKRAEDGKLVPLTGQEDFGDSFLKLVPNYVRIGSLQTNGSSTNHRYRLRPLTNVPPSAPGSKP